MDKQMSNPSLADILKIIADDDDSEHDKQMNTEIVNNRKMKKRDKGESPRKMFLICCKFIVFEIWFDIFHRI